MAPSPSQPPILLTWWISLLVTSALCAAVLNITVAVLVPCYGMLCYRRISMLVFFHSSVCTLLAPCVRKLYSVVCSDVTRGGQGGHIYPGANSLWGRWITAGAAERFQQCHKYFLQYSKFSFERAQGPPCVAKLRPWGRRCDHGGAKLVFFAPGAI